MSFQPLRRLSTLNKKWPDAEHSCGREIPTNRVGLSKSAWWACGPAMERFDRDIAPEIDVLLTNTGPAYTDIYIRLYMIGGLKETARPIIMVCSLNPSVRSEAEKAIRHGGILQKFPGYGLGASALPLEQPIPARKLALEVDNDDDEVVMVDLNTASKFITSDIMATTSSPRLGRALFTITSTGEISRAATAGVVLEILGNYYQLTAGHIDEPIGDGDGDGDGDDYRDELRTSLTLDELNDCHFDGQSTSGDDEDQAEEATHELNIAVTSRGSVSRSVTPDSKGSSWAGSFSQNTESGNLTDSESTSTPSRSAESSQSLAESENDVQESKLTSRAQQKSISREHREPSNVLRQNTGVQSLTRVGTIAHHSRQGKHPGLDYALIKLDSYNVQNHMNQIDLGKQFDRHTIHVEDIIPVGTEERQIIAVTASGGAVRGTLHPGLTHFRSTSRPGSQKLCCVQLDGVVVQGDCGSIVLDEKSGKLCGHIVQGCSGTQMAYIVPATDVFDDIRAHFGGLVLLRSWQPSQTQKPPGYTAMDHSPYVTGKFYAHIPPLLQLIQYGQLLYVNPGVESTPVNRIDIQGTIDKGFFLSEGEWNCYRRNYISCICAFSLDPPNMDNRSIQYKPNRSLITYKVFDFAMTISAVMSESDAFTIELVQHTPNRKNGSVSRPDKVKLSPKQPIMTPQPLGNIYTPPHLPGGGGAGKATGVIFGDYSQPQASYPTEHTFERIQFKQATANNRKRRAAQQYYHLVVELYAYVGDLNKGTPDQWMKVAQRKSAKLIVRGRSPGHYQLGRRGSSSIGSGRSSSTLGSYLGSQAPGYDLVGLSDALGSSLGLQVPDYGGGSSTFGANHATSG